MWDNSLILRLSKLYLNNNNNDNNNIYIYIYPLDSVYWSMTLWIQDSGRRTFLGSSTGSHGEGAAFEKFVSPLRRFGWSPQQTMEKLGKPWENHGKMVIYMERSTIFSWENSRFLWWFWGIGYDSMIQKPGNRVVRPKWPVLNPCSW